MAILKVIDMVPMTDREMAAVRAMLMGGRIGSAGHDCSPLQIDEISTAARMMSTTRGVARYSCA